MSATRSKSGLSGLDIQTAWATSGLKARLDALRTRLAPSDPVLLLHPDGTESVWQGDSRLADGAAAKGAKFVAVELPDELLLRRSLDMPAMSQADTGEAVLLEVRGSSPFAPEDMVWGHVMRELRDGQRRAEIAIASRKHVSDFIKGRWPELSTGDKEPEVWVVAGLPAPIVIGGWGEHRRLTHAASQRRWDMTLLVVAGVLASLAAMTPTIQLRFRAMEAADAFEALTARAAPLVRKRDEVAALNEKLRALDNAVADRVDPASVIAYLTQILPDDTHLYSLDLQKTKIIASGHTTDASALLQKLSADPKLRDVRFPAAVTRVPGAAKEAFTVEFTMDTKPPASSATAAISALPVLPTVAAPAAASNQPSMTMPSPPPAAGAVMPRAGTTPAAGGLPMPPPPPAGSAQPARPAAPVDAAAPAPGSRGPGAPPGAAPAKAGSSPFVVGGSGR